MLQGKNGSGSLGYVRWSAWLTNAPVCGCDECLRAVVCVSVWRRMHGTATAEVKKQHAKDARRGVTRTRRVRPVLSSACPRVRKCILAHREVLLEEGAAVTGVAKVGRRVSPQPRAKEAGSVTRYRTRSCCPDCERHIETGLPCSPLLPLTLTHTRSPSPSFLSYAASPLHAAALPLHRACTSAPALHHHIHNRLCVLHEQQGAFPAAGSRLTPAPHSSCIPPSLRVSSRMS